MVQLRDLYAEIQRCHPYTNIGPGNVQLPIAFRCADIVSVIRAFVSRRCSRHRLLSDKDLIIAIGKDLIAMGLIRVMLPRSKS